MVVSPDVVEKLTAAKTALSKHLDFLPGALNVLSSMVTSTILTGTHQSEAGLSQIFATVPSEDVQAVHVALEAVLEERKKILAKPPAS